MGFNIHDRNPRGRSDGHSFESMLHASLSANLKILYQYLHSNVSRERIILFSVNHYYCFSAFYFFFLTLRVKISEVELFIQVLQKSFSSSFF